MSKISMEDYVELDTHSIHRVIKEDGSDYIVDHVEDLLSKGISEYGESYRESLIKKCKDLMGIDITMAMNGKYEFDRIRKEQTTNMINAYEYCMSKSKDIIDNINITGDTDVEKLVEDLLDNFQVIVQDSVKHITIPDLANVISGTLYIALKDKVERKVMGKDVIDEQVANRMREIINAEG